MILDTHYWLSPVGFFRAKGTCARFTTVLVLGVICSIVSGCGGGGSNNSAPTPTPQPPPAPPPPPPADPEFDTVGMLTNFADNIIAENYQGLETALAGYAGADGSLVSYCDSIGGDNESNARNVAQEGWREVMIPLQMTEMHVIGPALDNDQALRNRIISYSAGRISTCGIDQAAGLVASSDADFNIATRAVNQKGFGAIEYLLFNEDLNHSCASVVPATMNWNELSDEAKRSARCELAQLIATDAAEAASLLSTRWTTFRTEFIDTGNTGNSLQLVTDAIFALDTLVKDEKLGIPLGIHDECSTYACPENVESKYSRNSLANVRANILTFLEIFQGGDGLGFDDLIIDEEFPEVSARFITNLNAVLAAIDASESALYDDALGIDDDSAVASCTNAFVAPDTGDPSDGVHSCRINGLLKRVTDDLKIDFVTIVGVSIPGSAQGDND